MARLVEKCMQLVCQYTQYYSKEGGDNFEKINDKIMEGAESLNFIVHTTIGVRRDFQNG